MEDAELLRAYAEHRAEDAFAELVRRHLNPVFNAAPRICGDIDKVKEVCPFGKRA